jgi:hypothetical protein
MGKRNVNKGKVCTFCHAEPVLAKGLGRRCYQRLWRFNHRKPPKDLTLKKCSVPDCPRDVVTKDMCRLHFDRWRRTGTTSAPVRVSIPVVCEVV